MLEAPTAKYHGLIDYRAWLRDMRSRPFSWWQERIQNNNFELRNLFSKDGSFTKLLSPSDPKLRQH